MPDPHKLCLLITRSIVFKPDDPLKPLQKYTYQRTALGHGNLKRIGCRQLQLRRCVKPFDPETINQLICRANFAGAVAQWQTLTTDQKEKMRPRAQARKLPIYGFFISETLKGKNPLTYI